MPQPTEVSPVFFSRRTLRQRSEALCPGELGHQRGEDGLDGQRDGVRSTNDATKGPRRSCSSARL